MKKQFFRILSCCMLLACLCALPAYAQEPKAAQPAAKEDKVKSSCCLRSLSGYLGIS